MLTATLSSKCSLIFSLDSTEKAVAMDLTQVEQKGVKLSILTFNLCIEPFKWKLDLFLHVEDILDQPFGELNITTQMVQGHLRCYLGRLNSLIVLDWTKLEVSLIGGAVRRSSYHQGLHSWYSLFSGVLTLKDKPGKALIVVHLQRPTENDLFKTTCDRLNGLFELQFCNVGWNLLKV